MQGRQFWQRLEAADKWADIEKNVTPFIPLTRISIINFINFSFSFSEVLIPEEETDGEGRDTDEAGCDDLVLQGNSL